MEEDKTHDGETIDILKYFLTSLNYWNLIKI